MPGILPKLKEVFDFDMKELTNNDDGALDALQTRGDDAIDWLVEKYFPMLSAATLKAQSLAVRLWVK